MLSHPTVLTFTQPSISTLCKPNGEARYCWLYCKKQTLNLIVFYHFVSMQSKFTYIYTRFVEYSDGSAPEINLGSAQYSRWGWPQSASDGKGSFPLSTREIQMCIFSFVSECIDVKNVESVTLPETWFFFQKKKWFYIPPKSWQLVEWCCIDISIWYNATFFTVYTLMGFIRTYSILMEIKRTWEEHGNETA